MSVIDFISGNFILIICVGIGLTIFLISSYRIEGFNSLMEKAIGIVVQQFCSLIIEAVCLIFKIINSLEIYIVLLIDALTGKASSNGKIASLAIGVLSMASFYTTYSGMKFFVGQDMIAFLITLGIQAILLSTSLRINDVLNLDVSKNDKSTLNIWIKCIGIGMVILGVGGCIVASVLSIISLSYETKKFIYHILYLIVIMAVIIIIGLMVLTLIQTGIKNRSVGGLLLLIYFAVLSVSSFFSYNSFVSIMYPESVRNIDDFQAYKIGIVNVIEQMNAEIDDDYYASLGREIELELQELENVLDNVNEEIYLSQEEQELYNQRVEFESYIKLMMELKELEEKAEMEEKRWREEESELITYSGGVGQYTTAMWTNKKEEHKTAMDNIQDEINKLEKQKLNFESKIVLNVENYQEMIQVLDNRKEEFDCSKEIDLIRILLNQEKEVLNEKEIEDAIFKIENAKLHLVETDNYRLKNDLGDIITVYWEYKRYKRQFYILENQILETNVEQGRYDESYRLIQLYAYEILMNLPDTNQIFYNANNEIIETINFPRSDYYSVMETMKRNVNPDLSVIERNIRTFVNNKLIGAVCALMALLIDMMILFVGIILPKDICYPYNEKGKYTENEIKRIMSNLFNKPIREVIAMWLKRKFKNFVASRPIVPHNVYGFEFSIELNLNEIKENKLSTILGYYVNEKKAVIEDDVAYIIPEYENYYVKPQNYKRQKLLKYTGDKNFMMMINQAVFVIGNLAPNVEKKQYFLKINQDEVRRYQCVLIVALLIDAGLAYINESDSQALYIVYDFQQKLETASKIQSDLSRFRTLLGECNNLAALLQLIEKGRIKGNKLFISQEDVVTSELNIEMVSLMDVGICTYNASYNKEGYELDVSFASWLLEYISNTSDRISFGDMYGK